MPTLSLCCFLFWLSVVAALSSSTRDKNHPFSCTGGTVYFSAHPVDGLLYQNPDLLHDLYVFKCVTTVVMTSGDRGKDGGFSQSLERGLQGAYALMANMPIDNPAREETMIRVGTHDLQSWSLRGMPNIQILYLRLPDGSPSGHGYATTKQESLSKLYHRTIDRISTTDHSANYTLRDVKELVAFILHARQPNDVRILNHKAKLPNDEDHHTASDHADHIVSAKLVQSIVAREKIKVNVTSYAGSIVRKFEANIKPTHRDFARKAAAYFKYAEYDEQMCQNLDACSDQLHDDEEETFADEDIRYAYQYLGREYNVL